MLYSLTKEPSDRPNYNNLRQLAFFSKYDSEDVDVESWYRGIKDKLYQ